jgi:hypothetical protein
MMNRQRFLWITTAVVLAASAPVGAQTNTWTALGPPGDEAVLVVMAPSQPTTETLLSNGKVLITGGSDSPVSLKTAELYDPAGGTFTPTTGPMTSSQLDVQRP